MHYANTFQEFDHGSSKNLKLYNSSVPPKIDTHNMKLSKIPIALYVGKDDMMVNIEDQHKIRNESKDVLVDYAETAGGHLQFFVGNDVKILRERMMK